MARVNLNYIANILRRINPGNPTEEEQSIATEFLKLWPDAKPVLEQFWNSPKCGTCRGHVVKLVREDPGRAAAFLKRVDPSKDWQVVPLSDEAHNPNRVGAGARSVIGEVHDIDDTPEEYARFIAEVRAKGGRYTGVAIRQTSPGRIRLYFY